MVKPKTDDQPQIAKRTPGKRTPTTANFDSLRRRMQEQNPHAVLFNLPSAPLPVEVHRGNIQPSTDTDPVGVHQIELKESTVDSLAAAPNNTHARYTTTTKNPALHNA